MGDWLLTGLPVRSPDHVAPFVDANAGHHDRRFGEQDEKTDRRALAWPAWGGLSQKAGSL